MKSPKNEKKRKVSFEWKWEVRPQKGKQREIPNEKQKCPTSDRKNEKQAEFLIKNEKYFAFNLCLNCKKQNRKKELKLK